MPIGVSATGSQVLAVTGTSAKFTNAMARGIQYFFTCETDCWITVAATGGSAVVDTANNIFVKAGMVIPLLNIEDSGTTNSFVHAIRQAVSGDATLWGVAFKNI